MPDVERLKRDSAEAAVALVEEGSVVGLGSGSTAYIAVGLIGERVRQGLRITAIATSEETARQARSLGIPLTTLDECGRIDLTIDGADEVERATLNLIKGRGGALLREKIVAAASRQLIIIVDERKLVERLGVRDPVPVEVVPFGWKTTAGRLRNLGAQPELRTSGGEPFLTDGGHYILDCTFGPIASPGRLAEQLDATVGVVEHGLFLGVASRVVVAGGGGVRTLLPA